MGYFQFIVLTKQNIIGGFEVRIVIIEEGCHIFEGGCYVDRSNLHEQH